MSMKILETLNISLENIQFLFKLINAKKEEGNFTVSIT